MRILAKISYYTFKSFKYVIVIFWLIGYSIRHRVSLNSLSRLNPELPNGGFCHLSKKYIYDYFTEKNAIAKKSFIHSVLIKPNSSFSSVKQLLKSTFGDNYYIIKPDHGTRSVGVHVITADSDLQRVLKIKDVPFIAQKYVHYPNELGIFYVRHPSWKRGKILGIALLSFKEIIGDGKSSLTELSPNLTGAMKAYLTKTYRGLDYVPMKGQAISLVNTADHNFNERYINRPDLINDALLAKIELIIGKRKFYFGRFDVRAETLTDLKKGNFAIMEVNCGPDAVSLHALDPKYPLHMQLKIYINQFRHAFSIAKENAHYTKTPFFQYLWSLIKDERDVPKLKRS